MVERQLGGEAGHRSFFGGSGKGPRNILLALCGVGLVVGAPFFGAPAVVVAVIAALLVFLVTARTHRGSILDRANVGCAGRDRAPRRHRPLHAVRRRTVGPADPAQARTRRGKEDPVDGRTRACGDADHAGRCGRNGMASDGPARAGNRLARPDGEKPYLSVVFTVTGQLRGAEPTRVASSSGRGFRGVPGIARSTSSLLRRVQGDHASAAARKHSTRRGRRLALTRRSRPTTAVLSYGMVPHAAGTQWCSGTDHGVLANRRRIRRRRPWIWGGPRRLARTDAPAKSSPQSAPPRGTFGRRCVLTARQNRSARRSRPEPVSPDRPACRRPGQAGRRVPRRITRTHRHGHQPPRRAQRSSGGTAPPRDQGREPRRKANGRSCGCSTC